LIYFNGTAEFGAIKHVKLKSLLIKQKHIQYVVPVHPVPFLRRVSREMHGVTRYSSTGAAEPVFLDDSVNSEVYLKVLQDNFCSSSSRHGSEGGRTFIPADGASHMLRMWFLISRTNILMITQSRTGAMDGLGHCTRRM
jgi:hypothetical protein